jgi:hypothetical protein
MEINPIFDAGSYQISNSREYVKMLGSKKVLVCMCRTDYTHVLPSAIIGMAIKEQ